MNYSGYGLILASIVWMNCASALWAFDAPASIEITSVKLSDTTKFSVEFTITNTSDNIIYIDTRPWVRLASLNGTYSDTNPLHWIMSEECYKPVLTIYATLPVVLGDWSGNWPLREQATPPPLALKPREKRTSSITIDMQWVLGKDFISIASKDLWMRVGLCQWMGAPTAKENQDLMNQYHVLTSEAYAKVQAEVLNKYFPKEITHGDLFKLEIPKTGENVVKLQTLKAPF